MHIPRAWAKVTGDGRSPDGRIVPISVWGWGNDEASARSGGLERLQRVLERVRRGDPFPDRYGYGNRPLKEEILRTFESTTPDEPLALLTRNGYGCQVLNAARLLFLDVDLPQPSLGQRILGLFGGAPPEAAALAKIRSALQQYGQATFRIYRTAAGFRAIAIDREFDPTERDAQELMQATATDPAFARLCVAQRSFRARLTPKPWRCKCPVPPGRYPWPEGEGRQRFATWLNEYETASTGYATCRYLEKVGSGSPAGNARALIEFHDRTTRCNEALPLA